jgi:hypothetical protein
VRPARNPQIIQFFPQKMSCRLDPRPLEDSTGCWHGEPILDDASKEYWAGWNAFYKCKGAWEEACRNGAICYEDMPREKTYQFPQLSRQ